MILRIDMGEGSPRAGVILDGHGTAIMVPAVISYMQEWSRERIVAYCEYRGWNIVEISED